LEQTKEQPDHSVCGNLNRALGGGSTPKNPPLPVSA
jgi:hypothetical protein